MVGPGGPWRPHTLDFKVASGKLPSTTKPRRLTQGSSLNTTEAFYHAMGAHQLTPGVAATKADAPKNIVLCFDGTESKFGPAPYTNSLKLFRLLDKDDPTEQICYYQPGIGASMTVESNTSWNLKETITSAVDALVAFSLDTHIIQAYKFLMRFYCKGDKIYLFGFSRGAFTARVLSSMIECVGLLNPGLEELVEGAWSIYSAWEYAAQPSQPDYTTTLVDEFKKTFTRAEPVGIEFMGLFETVNSVGIIRDRMFPFTTRFNLVKQIRHAVSLDERRTKYKQNLIYPYSYQPHIFSLNCTPTPQSKKKAQCVDQASMNESPSNHDCSKKTLVDAGRMMDDLKGRLNRAAFEKDGPNGKHHQYRGSVTSSSLEFDKAKLLSGEFQELWFPGNHGDVGGGWPPSLHGQFLSCAPLRWMLAEAIQAGVIFHKGSLTAFSERYSSLDSMLSPSHDSLALWNQGLTLKINDAQKLNTLKLSTMFGAQEQTVRFSSFETKIDSTYKDLLNSGVYSTSLNRLNVDIHGPTSPRAVFQYYNGVPDAPIRGCDGRGTSSLLRTMAWWLLELLPWGTKIEDKNGEWKNIYIPNFGRLRSLPAYAQLHWSVLWRMKYCYDYCPQNLPKYIQEVWKGKVPGCEDTEDPLLRLAISGIQSQLKEWDATGWKIVPDDLSQVLKEAGYLDPDDCPESDPGVGCSAEHQELNSRAIAL